MTSDTVVISVPKTISRSTYYKRMSEQTVRQIIAWYEALAQHEHRANHRSVESIHAEFDPQLREAIGPENYARFVRKP